MTRTLLVTGTDTGVGKTHITAALLRALVRAGLPVTPLKLVETGLRLDERGELVPEDGARLATAASWRGPLEVIAPLRFALAAAPATAARAESRTLTADQLRAAIDRASAFAPRLVIEGAGGLLVPLTTDGTTTLADLAQGHALVVVARNALGTLNHTALTVEAAQRRGLRVAAVVLNEGPTRDGLPHRDDLRRILPADIPVLGPMPWMPGAALDACASAIEREVATVTELEGWFL